VSPWLAKEFSLHDYFKHQYFRINKHIRRGLIAGLILLIMVAPLPIIFYRYKGVWFWEFIRRLYWILLWPLKRIVETLNISPWSSGKGFFFILVLAYLVAIGFVIGVSISYFGKIKGVREKKGEAG
jgi:hypothetical protein